MHGFKLSRFCKRPTIAFRLGMSDKNDHSRFSHNVILEIQFILVYKIYIRYIRFAETIQYVAKTYERKQEQS